MPKKHEQIETQLQNFLETSTGLSGIVSKDSFSALDPLAKKYLEKSYDYCQKKQIDLSSCSVKDFVNHMKESLTYRIENISDDKGQGGGI